MAVFKLNICKFNNCELIFNNLESLIKHIETNHINYDPKIIEQFETQPPTCLPLFFFSDIPPSSEEKSNTENSKLKPSLSSPKSSAQQTNNCFEKNATGQSDAQSDAQNLRNEGKSENWVAVKTNSRVVKNAKLKKTYKCSCGKTYGTSPSLRKHVTQCRNTAVITAQVKEILQQKGAELSTSMNNDNYNSSSDDNLTQQYSSPVSLKQISATSGTSLKTLVVSKKPTTKTIHGVSQTVQQPQRVMIQLAELNSVTA